MNYYTFLGQDRTQCLITLAVIFFSTCIAGFSIYAYILYPDFRNILVFSAIVVAICAGVIACRFLIIAAGKTSTIDRTLSYIERWNNSSFDKQELIRFMREIRSNKGDDNDIFIRDKLTKEDDLKSKLISTLNFFEEMALVIEKRLVEEDILRNFFKGIVMDYVGIFYIWIQERSKGGLHSEDNYKELKQIYKKWGGNGG